MVGVDVKVDCSVGRAGRQDEDGEGELSVEVMGVGRVSCELCDVICD